MSYIYSMVDLWNEGGTTFKGIQINVTNTSSAAASRVMDLQVGGVSQFQVAPNGQQFGTLGTALLPSISFIGDPNTGMWSPAADTIAWSTAGAEAMRITSTGNVVLNPSSGNVSIGTFTTSDKLTINGGGIFAETDTNGSQDVWIRNVNAGASARARVVLNASGNSWGMGMGSSANNGNALTWNVDVGGANSEKMRITTAGDVGLGTSSPNKASKDRALTINGSSNAILEFAQGDALKGYIYNDASVFQVDAGPTARMAFVVNSLERVAIETSGHVTPGADNTQNFGSGSLRWATIFAGTGTINTSDERYKVLREGGDLSDAEYRAWSNVRAIVYQDKDSFERKGSAARLHVGYSWQSIQAAFEAEGLDAGRYGLWCEDALEAPVEKTRTVQRQATEAVEQPYEEVRIVDGAPVMVRGTRTVDQPIFENIQVTDAATGKPVFLDGEPMMAPVPVMEDFEEEFTEMEPTGETRGALRYNQCSVIEAAWLRRELAALTARLSALEAA